MTLGILIISHGSPRTEVNAGFVALVQRMSRRLEAGNILPAFFSIAQPDIPAQVDALAARGAQRIVLVPYFLYAGQHVTVDIPAQLAECGRRHPGLSFEVLPTLENEPALADLVVERLMDLPDAVGGTGPVPPAAQGLCGIPDPASIERRSYEIIEQQLASWPASGFATLDDAARQIVRRVIHATADFSYARTLRIHPQAVAAGVAALAAGRPIICDVRMLQSGVTKVRGEVHCAIGDDDVATLARQKGCTRAAAAFEKLAPRWEGAIVAVGNAPTALEKVLEITARGGPRPALVVGLPVGLVGAKEAKHALAKSDLVYITNIGPRGGTPVAAAAVNALALQSGSK